MGTLRTFLTGIEVASLMNPPKRYVEISSDLLPFEQRPWMKGGEITDVILDSIRAGKHDFIRVNYPHGDMVGHTGDLLAVEISVEAVDLCLARIKKEIDRIGGVMIVAADHGNADEMYELDKDKQPKLDANGIPKKKTSHTLNPVPCYIYEAGNTKQWSLSTASDDQLGISSLAATVMMCLGFEAPENYDPSIVSLK